MTFIELPLLRNNQDIMDVTIQLRERCFNTTLFYIEWGQWDEILASEDFQLLLAYIKLNADEVLKSFRILIVQDFYDTTDKSQILNELEDAFKEIFKSGFTNNQVIYLLISIYLADFERIHSLNGLMIKNYDVINSKFRDFMNYFRLLFRLLLLALLDSNHC